MKVDINELAGYFSRLQFHLIDVVRVVVPPGGKCYGASTPPFSGMLLPLRGRARMVFDGAAYEMEPNNMYYAGPNMNLDKEVLGKSQWELAIIHYQVEGREKETRPYTWGHYHLALGHNSRVNELLHRLYQVCATPGSLPELRAKSIFLTIMEEAITAAGRQYNGKGRELIEEAKEYIHQHYMEPLSVVELGERYGLNGKQFSYLFRKHTGICPNEYLIEQRMSRAKEILASTTCSVAEVAQCVGYPDPYYFSKQFKKRTGFCPSLLRRCTSAIPAGN